MPDEKVGMKELESEFGLEGNVPADAPADAGYGGDEVAAETTEKAPTIKEPDTDAIAAETERLQSLEGLDDNVKIAEQEEANAKAAREKAAAEKAAEESEASDEAPGDEEEEEEVADDGEAEDEGGEEIAAEGAEEAEETGKEVADPWAAWVQENLQDAEQQTGLFEALLKLDPDVEYQSNGQLVREPLSELKKKAAGYAGQGEVSRQLQEAKQARDTAAAEKAEADALRDQLAGFQKELTETIDDPTNFVPWLAEKADLDYLTQLRDQLDATVQQIEENPQLHASNRNLNTRLGRIEDALARLAGGGAPPESADAGASKETPAPETPTSGDFGFQPGEGYPESTSSTVLSALKQTLDGTDVELRTVVDRWNAGNRKQTLFAVARGLLRGGAGNAEKAKIALKPPVGKRPSTEKGQRPRKPEANDSTPAKKTGDAWDAIPGKVAAELEALQQTSEL
jgi:hypothetical protein